MRPGIQRSTKSVNNLLFNNALSLLFFLNIATLAASNRSISVIFRVEDEGVDDIVGLMGTGGADGGDSRMMEW